MMVPLNTESGKVLAAICEAREALTWAQYVRMLDNALCHWFYTEVGR